MGFLLNSVIKHNADVIQKRFGDQVKAEIKGLEDDIGGLIVKQLLLTQQQIDRLGAVDEGEYRAGWTVTLDGDDGPMFVGEDRLTEADAARFAVGSPAASAQVQRARAEMEKLRLAGGAHEVTISNYVPHGQKVESGWTKWRRVPGRYTADGKRLYVPKKVKARRIARNLRIRLNNGINKLNRKIGERQASA